MAQRSTHLLPFGHPGRTPRVTIRTPDRRAARHRHARLAGRHRRELRRGHTCRVRSSGKHRQVAAQSSKAFAAGRYIVTFADEPAATYDGAIGGYARTRPDAGRKLDPTRGEVLRYRARLTAIHDSALAAVGARKIYDYTVTTNGVAAQLTSAQARRLSGAPGVVSLEKDVRRQLTTTESPAFLGLSDAGGLWSRLGGSRTAGSGVIVGVIDSGIWPESPSFAGAELKRDRAGLPVESTGLRGRWFGACVQGEQFDSQDCNDKLIGARYYVDGFGKQDLLEDEYLSPRDGGGHGTHTASTAAGNRVEGVEIDGFAQGTASGMAPGARVAAYKVCWEGKSGGGCANSDSVAAIDDAVADGVDVINYSVGSSSESSPLDAVEQAYRRAANAGIFVANSAGNSGPGASTLDHPSPWLTTVAASTFRKAQQALELGDGRRFVGASITSTLPQTALVTSVSVKLASATERDAALCVPGTLDAAKAAGKLVQCDRGVIARVDKSFEVSRAGGAGMVLTNTAPSSLNSDFHAVPTVHVDEKARAAILAYIAEQGTTATAAVTALRARESSIQVPEVAEFSSRGPSTTTGGDILKPDLSAPGVDVLAAVAPPSNHGRSYDFYSGTSMSSPHIAGIAALVKAAHPGWSPMAVKSALMTTARDHATTTDPFAQGAGFVRPNTAVDPGLVFDAGANDWRSWMKSLGVQFAPPYDTLPVVEGPDLNQASIAVGAMAGRRTITRTVTNVSSTSEKYTVRSAVPGISVAASPERFTIAPGASQKVTITLTRADAALGAYAKGFVTLTGSAKHVVRVPVAVRPVAISAPAEITGTIAEGSKTFSVTPGFTGTLSTTVAGLIGATPEAGSVTTGPFDFTAPATSAATKAYTMDVAAGTSLVRFDVDATSDADDLDLFVYRNGELVAYSASGAADERVTIREPQAGTYVAYVNGYSTGAGGAYTHTSWAVGTGAAGNLAVSPRSTSATLARPVSLTASWSGLDPAKRYLGLIGYGGATEITVVSVNSR